MFALLNSALGFELRGLFACYLMQIL